MKTYNEFLNRIQQAYDKEYNTVQTEDIIIYFESRQFPISALDNLYELIVDNEHYFPKREAIKKRIDEASKGGMLKTSSGLDPESPLQQLYKHKDKSAEKIISGCKWIRGQQNIRELKSYEISYLAIWDRLCDIKDEFIEIAKNRIVQNGDKELYSGTQVDLKDLQIEYKPIKISEERNNSSVTIKQALEDII
jgi:hypothetical protein